MAGLHFGRTAISRRVTLLSVYTASRLLLFAPALCFFPISKSTLTFCLLFFLLQSRINETKIIPYTSVPIQSGEKQKIEGERCPSRKTGQRWKRSPRGAVMNVRWIFFVITTWYNLTSILEGRITYNVQDFPHDTEVTPTMLTVPSLCNICGFILPLSLHLFTSLVWALLLGP